MSLPREHWAGWSSRRRNPISAGSSPWNKLHASTHNHVLTGCIWNEQATKKAEPSSHVQHSRAIHPIREEAEPSGRTIPEMLLEPWGLSRAWRAAPACPTVTMSTSLPRSLVYVYARREPPPTSCSPSRRTLLPRARCHLRPPC